MIKQIKEGIQLLRYTYGIKSSIVLFCCTLLIGVLMINAMPSHWTGTYMILAAAMWPIQMLYSLNASNMITASPKAKKIQTSISASVGFLCFAMAYFITLIIRTIQFKLGILSEATAGYLMILNSVYALLILLYLGVALKYFICGTITFCVSIAILAVCIQIVPFCQMLEEIQMPFLVASLIAFLLLVAASFLQYALTLLVYRKPASKLAQTSGLRKSL